MQTSITNDSRVFIDHYAALGLTIEATGGEIKKQFRQLAKKCHPDVAGGDGLKFLELYSAYKLLSNNSSRNRYNSQYVHFIRSAFFENMPGRIEIPLSRLVYPVNVATLARKGLLKKTVSNRQRRFILNVDYDIELPLSEKELNRAITIRIPVIARTLCPDCHGSNTRCHACNGRGSYKKTHLLALHLEGGLTDGQILEIKLSRMPRGSLSYFKKKKVRIKITCNSVNRDF